jgi:hypothetical protein
MKTLTFDISDEAYDLLLKIKKEGYAEYRDNQFETLDDFINSDLYTVQNKSVDWFMSRNFDGTYKFIPELKRYGLIKLNEMSWHDTYVLTLLGNKVTE